MYVYIACFQTESSSGNSRADVAFDFLYYLHFIKHIKQFLSIQIPLLMMMDYLFYWNDVHHSSSVLFDDHYRKENVLSST